MEGLNKIYGRALDLVLVPGSFRPNGSSGVVSGSVKGQGFSIARTSQGLYAVTFDEKWPNVTGGGLVAFIPQLRLAAATGAAFATGGVVSQSARTAQIRVFSRSGGVGFIPIDVAQFRFVDTNAVDNLAGHGGIMAKDQDPRLERINGATDPCLRIRWGSASSSEIMIPNIPIPADLDPGSDIFFKILAGKSGDAEPTATLTVEFHEKALMDVAAGMFAAGNSIPDDIGGTIVVNNTLEGQGIGNAREYSLTIANADLDGPPGFFNIQLTPSNIDAAALDVYAAYIEYTRSGDLVDLAADVDNEVEFLAVIQDSLVAA